MPVQDRVAIAQPKLPTEVRHLGITVRKNSPDLMIVIHLSSPGRLLDQLCLSNYATLQGKAMLARPAGLRVHYSNHPLDHSANVGVPDDESLTGVGDPRQGPGRTGRAEPQACSQPATGSTCSRRHSTRSLSHFSKPSGKGLQSMTTCGDASGARRYVVPSFVGSGATGTPTAIFCRLPTMILSPSRTSLSMTTRLP